MTSQGETIVVGMGEMRVTNSSSAVLTCLGLGSCIALCAYDPVSRVGGMAHVVLPHHDGRDGGPSPKYADTAVPLLLREMSRCGAVTSRIVVKMTGGAQLVATAGFNGIFKTGERNAEAAKAAVVREGLAVAASELGGHRGRTVRMHLDTGKVAITSSGQEVKDL